MKKIIPILLAILSFVGCSSSNDKDVTYRQITMKEAVTMMAEEESYIILDVRTAEEYASAIFLMRLIFQTKPLEQSTFDIWEKFVGYGIYAPN